MFLVLIAILGFLIGSVGMSVFLAWPMIYLRRGHGAGTYPNPTLYNRSATKPHSM